MYPYFYELEKKGQFVTYCQSMEKVKEVPLFQYPIQSISINQLSELKQVLEILPTIDLLLARLKVLLVPNEKQEAYTDFLNYDADNRSVIQSIKGKIDITNNDLLDLLKIYLEYVSFLMLFFQKENLQAISKLLKSTIKWVEGMCWIEIPVQKTKEQLWPDNWYITPNGYLYNACKNGKKTGGLFWTFHSISSMIEKLNSKKLFQKKIEELKRHIASLESRDYVTFFEYEPYRDYAPFPFSSMPNIQSEEELGCSYQKNLKILVLGYLNAELCIYEHDLKLYEEKQGKIEILFPDINHTEEDILIQIYGFHRVEPIKERTITTLSETSLELLGKYQQQGWTIRIVPSITIGPPKVYQKNYN